MRFSTKGAGIAVTVIFAAAATFVPLPVTASWRPLVGSLAWVAVLLACYVYLEAHVDSLARFRHNFQKTSPVLMLSIVFLVCGCLGIGVFALFKANEPKADAAATTEPPSAKNGPTLAVKSRGRQSTPAPRHINTFSVLEIHKELELAGPLERDEVAEQFRHGIVDWTLIFSGDLIRPRGTESMTVRFLPQNSPYPKITCPDIKVEGNAYLGRIRSPTRFRVRGVIGDIDLNWFTLHEATFEQLSDSPATPTPVPSTAPSPTAKSILDRIKIIDTPDGAILAVENLETTPTPTPETKPSSDLNPRQLFALIEGKTPLQVVKLIAPYKGRWIEAEGPLTGPPQPAGSRGCNATISLNPEGKLQHVECRFEQRWCDQLDRLNNKAEIKVRGKIETHNGQTLLLSECDLISPTQP